MITLYAEDPGARMFIDPVASELGSECKLYTPTSAPRMVASFLRSKPDIVGVGTSEAGDSVGLRLLHEARRKRIATFSWIEGYSFLDKRFMGQTDNPLWAAPDLIFVASEVIAWELKRLGYTGEIIVSGHPFYDICRTTHPPPSEEIVFLSERSDCISGDLKLDDDYTLHGRGTSGWRTHIVIEEFLDATQDIGIPRRLQIHPKEAGFDYLAYEKEFDQISRDRNAIERMFGRIKDFRDLFTATAESGIIQPRPPGHRTAHLLHLVRPCLAVGITTNALTEFALRGSPVLSILPRNEEYVWNDAIAVGAIPSVSHRKYIRPVIERLLSSKPRTEVLDDLYPSGAVDKIIRRLDECLLTSH